MYQKSKDYNTLYNLVKEGKEVICYATEVLPFIGSIRGIYFVEMEDGVIVRIYNEEDRLLSRSQNLDTFLSECTRLNVEWIVPQEEEKTKTFALDQSQMDRLEKWQKTIKKKFGEYGHYEYRFTPTGIGCGIEVYSHSLKKSLDLSDVEKW